MSRIHLRSNTLVLWLSLSAVAAASALGVGCSSSDAVPGETEAGAAGKAGGKAGAGNTAGAESGDAGDTGTGGTGETGGTGGGEEPRGGSGGDEDPVGAGGEGGEAAVDPNAAAIERGKAVIAAQPPLERCTQCHQLSYKGALRYPNLTPDETTGIGTWTDAEIKAAIIEGKGKRGQTLCTEMKRYAFTDDEVADVIAFLRSLTPVTNEITTACTNP